jgi:hypothetical protein
MGFGVREATWCLSVCSRSHARYSSAVMRFVAAGAGGLTWAMVARMPVGPPGPAWHDACAVPRRARRSPVALALVCASAALGPGAGGDARAQSGDTCVGAYEGAQERRQRGALVEAARELDLCLGACPEALARDCATWRREISARLARVTIDARLDGASARPGAVAIDGRAVVIGEGNQVDIDPGAHVIRVEIDRADPVERSVTLAEGQRATLRFEAATRSVEPWPPTSAIVIGTAGGGALLLGAGLGIAGHLQVSDLRDTCAPDCAPSDVSAVRTTWIVGGVAAGVGLGAVAVAIAVALGAGPDAAESGVALGSSPDGGPLGASCRASF